MNSNTYPRPVLIWIGLVLGRKGDLAVNLTQREGERWMN